MQDGRRELGTIESAEIRDTDHGCLSVEVYIKFRGSGQSFGGLALQHLDDNNKPEDDKLINDYIKSLCETFGVQSLKDLAGLKCYALRPTDNLNEYIVGIESVNTGKRFTHYAWRKKHVSRH
jgi:hypothetical protein